MIITEARKLKIGDKVRVKKFPDDCIIADILPEGKNRIVFRFTNGMHLYHFHVEKKISD